MLSRRTYFNRAMTTAATPCLAMLLFAFPALAQSSNSNYIVLLASGSLCDPGDSSSCPATAKSNPGDSYEISGAGTFDVHTKSVKAAGTYTHKSPAGNVLETGVWIASELVSFDSYGAAPNALPQQRVGLDVQPLAHRRLPMSLGPVPTGGLAVFHIRLLSMSGRTMNAVLQVNSTLGYVPRERSVEGIRLYLEKGGAEFSEEISGRVMFLAMRPEISAPNNIPQQEPAPDSAETPKEQEQSHLG